MNKIKKFPVSIISTILILLLVATMLIPKQNLVVSANFDSNLNHKSSILIDSKTGKILYANNENEKLPIASVTKLMTILLTLEEIENNNLDLNDKIIVSENASGMGGSQIFLDANCEYKIGDLLKSVIVASANDSSVALAEHIAGSEQNFVKLMNEKASLLNLKNTNYSNCTGLPSPNGYSSSLDQAIVLNEVIKYDIYHEFSSIWMEDFVHPSGRTTQMTNTNKLSRFYEGCTGGKTGSTNQAKYCLAVSAKRNDTTLISVVLGADNSKDRFKLASDLLNYGFNNFESKVIFSIDNLLDKQIKIKGTDVLITLKPSKDYSILVQKNEDVNFSLNYHLPNQLKKVKENDIVGTVDIVIDGIVVDSIGILSASTYEEPNIWDYFKEIISAEHKKYFTI